MLQTGVIRSIPNGTCRNKFDSTDLRVWVAETFDCDDFAQVLQGNVNQFFPGIAFGTIWYGAKDGSFGHAVNIFYDYQDDQTWLVEPQDDSFYLFDKDLWDAYIVSPARWFDESLKVGSILNKQYS